MAIKTLTASELIKQIQDEMDRFGDLPIYMTDHAKNELPLDSSSIRFAERISVRKTRTSTEVENQTGRFYILSDL